MQKSINKLRILTPEKFQAEYPHIFKRNFGEIALNRVHFCKAECLRQAVTGTFAIPRKTKLTGDKITFGYCIAEEQLIFIENQDHIKIEMKKVREYQDEERTSPLLLLFDWMEYLIKDDMLFLQDYEEKSFWESNPYFYIYTPDGREITYHIYSAGQVEDTSDTYLTSFESEEAYQSFLNMTKEASLYDTGVELNAQSAIVTLSTCTSASDNHRFVVRGVKEKEVNLKEQ